MAKKVKPLHLATVTVASVATGLALQNHYGTDWYQFFGFVSGVVGVYLVAVENILNWPIGLANIVLSAWLFFTTRLYADMSLQFFFFVLQIQGWVTWAKGGKEANTELPITWMKPSGWVYCILAVGVGFGIYYPITKHFNGAAPAIDSTLTSMSIVAQVLLNFKKIENWIIWILVDIAYVPLYYSRKLEPYAVLYAIFLCLAISGLIAWLRAHRAIGNPAQSISSDSTACKIDS